MDENMITDTQVVKTEAIVSVQPKSDSTNRANRTMLQAFIASGVVIGILTSLQGQVNIDPIYWTIIIPIASWLTSYVQNQLEATGHSVPGLSKPHEPEMVVESASVEPAEGVTVESNEEDIPAMG